MQATFARSNLLAILLIALMLTQGCSLAPAPVVQAGPAMPSSGVMALQTRTSLYVVRQAITGQEGTFIYVKDNLTLYGSRLLDGYGFVILRNGDFTGVKEFMEGQEQGQYAKWSTLRPVIDYLKRLGWQEATPDQIDPVLKVGAETFAAWVMRLAAAWYTMCVGPAGAFTPPDYMPVEVKG